jgi:hypothetical protein
LAASARRCDGTLAERGRRTRQAQSFLRARHSDEAARDLGEHVELRGLALDLDGAAAGARQVDTGVAFAAQLNDLRQRQRRFRGIECARFAGASEVLRFDSQLRRRPQCSLPLPCLRGAQAVCECAQIRVVRQRCGNRFAQRQSIRRCVGFGGGREQRQRYPARADRACGTYLHRVLP